MSAADELTNAGKLILAELYGMRFDGFLSRLQDVDEHIRTLNNQVSALKAHITPIEAQCALLRQESKVCQDVLAKFGADIEAYFRTPG